MKLNEIIDPLIDNFYRLSGERASKISLGYYLFDRFAWEMDRLPITGYKITTGKEANYRGIPIIQDVNSAYSIKIETNN